MKKILLQISLLLIINFCLPIFSIAQVISHGASHCITLCNNGKVSAWGANNFGQLGDGTIVNKTIPIQVSGLTEILEISCGYDHSLALKNDSTVWAWGNNGYGQMGDNTYINRTIPVQVIGLTGIISIAGGGHHSIALKKDGTVWAWGKNNHGSVGDGTTIQRKTAVQVFSLTGITAIIGGYDHSLALKNDGTVWAWGNNIYGALGDSTYNDSSIPVQVRGLTGIISIAAGNYHSLALKNDGTIWTFGLNANGQLGDGTATFRNTPVHVIGLTGITDISGGEDYSIALKNNGTTWAWGINAYGQLGDGTTIDRAIPIQVHVLANIIAIDGGGQSIALKNDGTVWSWGSTAVQQTGLCMVTKGMMASTSQTNVTCNGGSNGSITVTPLKGIFPYTYQWSNGQTTATVTNLTAGNYNVIVTDANANLANTSVTITQPAALSATHTQTNIPCNGDNNGAINLNVTGGTGNFSYSWTNGASSQNVSGLIAGSYTVMVVDAVCTDTITNAINISQPSILTATVSSTATTCGKNNGSISVISSGGSAPYSYLWNNGIHTSAINNLSVGNYNITVTDAHGCTNTSNDSVIQQSPAVISTISSTNVQCDLFSNGSATVSISSGTPGYTYVWSTSPVQNTPTAIGLSAGTYTITVTDTNGCFTIDTAFINISHHINITANATRTIIFPGTSVTLMGGGTISYTWTGGIIDGIPFVPSSTNTYTVTGTDGSGCSNTAEITVTVKDFHQIISCGYSYSLSLCSNGILKDWGDNQNGQLGDGSVIQKNSPVQVSGLTDIMDIDGGNWHSLALKNDSTLWAWGDNYNGQLGDGTTIEKHIPVHLTSITGIIAVSCGSSHTLALKNDGTVWAFGLNDKGQLGDGTLINKHAPVQVIGLSHIVSIATGYYFSLALKNDGTVWTWGDNGWGQLGSNIPNHSSTAHIINGLSGITSIAGGENHSLALKDDGTVWAWGINNTGELGNGTNNYSHTPIGVSGLTDIIAIAAGMSHSLALKKNGTVWAWGLNGSGQFGNGTTINSNIPVQANSLTGINAIAAGAAHSLAQKNDGTVWAWGLNLTGQIGDGTYSNYRYTPVQVNGLCIVVSLLTANISQTNNMCLTDNNGVAAVIPNGGIPPYTYLWSNGQTTATVTNLIAGSYTVTITDAINNNITRQVTILGGAQISSTVKNTLCNGGSDGTIDLFISNGSGSYSYTWSNGAHSQNLNGLTSGNYTVTIIDGICGETLTNIINVNSPSILTSLVTSFPATCGNNNGSASIVPSGGISPYSYLWSNGETSSIIHNLMQANYTVTITDANGCSFADTSYILQQYPQVTSSISAQTNVLCNGANTGNATVMPNGGTPNYSFLWNTLPAQITQSAYNLSAGIYNVKITDANGCIHFDSVTITQSAPVPVTANSNATVIFPGHSIILTGGGASSYIWSGGISDGIAFIPALTNSYTVTGTDANGCSNTAVIIITVKKKHHIMAAGNSFSLALCSDSVMSWNTGNTPALVSYINGITDLAAGQFHSLALKNDGTLWAWGENGSGALGNGTTVTSNIPSQVVNLTGIIDIAGGNDHSLALKSDGTVWAWGGNSNGQLGDGTLAQRLTPVQVIGLTGIIQIYAGTIHSLALKSDGTVWAWGSNPNGQLGDGTNIQRTTAVQVIGLNGVNVISSGGTHCLALKNDSTVWSWGSDAYGELGVGLMYSSNIPVQVHILSGITDIVSGHSYSLAMKNDSIIFGWGDNSHGQLAAAVSSCNIPIQLPALSNPIAMACGYYHSLILKNDGTIWATGNMGTAPYQVNGLCPVFIDPNVWPGDADKNNIVDNNDLLPIGLFYGQTGLPRTSGSNNSWQPYSSINWGTTEMNGADIKNTDCNGDGLINENDTLAINLNFNLTHTITTNNNNNFTERTAPSIYFVTTGSSYNAGDWIDAEVWLGNSATPVNNLYGLAFNINYNSLLVQPGTESITYPASWFGIPGTNELKISKIDALANTAHGAVTRITHTNASGYGKIADFKFRIKTSLTSAAVMHLSVSNYKADNSAGIAQTFTTTLDSISINPAASGITETNNLFGITISPNPFSSLTTITFNQEQKNAAIKIMDMLGKQIKSIDFKGRTLILEKEEMEPGIYFLQISDENKTVIKRKIIIQ